MFASVDMRENIRVHGENLLYSIKEPTEAISYSRGKQIVDISIMYLVWKQVVNPHPEEH